MSDLVARFRAEADSDAAFEAAMRLVRETVEDNARLREALGSVRRAILEAPAGIIGDTLWCVDSQGETVIDRIDGALAHPR